MSVSVEKVAEKVEFYSSKRILDLVGSISSLIFFTPIYIIISLIILITDGRPILFRQARVGEGGKTFYIYKFRSMQRNAEKILQENSDLYEEYVKNDYKFPEGKDPRITKFGNILRKTSLDELPQFWNVLMGDMSLVGPRPIVIDELNEYSSNKIEFLKMKPGITGIWQVSGRSNIQYPERSDLELSYLQYQGLWFDIKILLKTIFCVFNKIGAH